MLCPYHEFDDLTGLKLCEKRNYEAPIMRILLASHHLRLNTHILFCSQTVSISVLTLGQQIFFHEHLILLVRVVTSSDGDRKISKRF